MLEEQNTILESKIKKDILKEINSKPIQVQQDNNFDFASMKDEDLFKLKLQSFEIEQVKNSTNRELKSSLRKSQTFMEAVAYTAALILDK